MIDLKPILSFMVAALITSILLIIIQYTDFSLERPRHVAIKLSCLTVVVFCLISMLNESIYEYFENKSNERKSD